MAVPTTIETAGPKAQDAAQGRLAIRRFHSFGFSFQNKRSSADPASKGGRGPDQHVPGKRDGGLKSHIQHQRQTGSHAADGRRFRPRGASARPAGIRPTGSRTEPRRWTNRPRNLPQWRASRATANRIAPQAPWSDMPGPSPSAGFAPTSWRVRHAAKKVHYRGGGQRVQRGRKIGHRRGQDGRHHQSGHAGRKIGPDKQRINAVRHRRGFPVAIRIEREQAHPDHQKKRELHRHQHPTGEQRGAAGALAARRPAAAAPSIVRCHGWRW